MTPDPAEVIARLAALGNAAAKQPAVYRVMQDAIAALAAVQAERDRAQDEAGTVAGAYQLAKQRAEAAEAERDEAIVALTNALGEPPRSLLNGILQLEADKQAEEAERDTLRAALEAARRF